MPKNLLLVGKLVISIGLLALLLSNVGWNEMLAGISSMQPSLVALTFFILIIQFPLSNWKWQLVLSHFALHYRFAYLHVVICIGFFFNNFLPTGIGGDVYRVLKTIPDSGGKSKPVSAVLVDRVVGMLSLLLLGYFGAWMLYFTHDIRLIDDWLPGLSAAGVGLLLAVYFFLPERLWQSVLNKLLANEKVAALAENLRGLTKPSPQLLAFLLVSLFFQLLAIIALYSLFLAVGAEISIWHCAVIAASSGIVVMLPISINGIGVLEGSIVMVAALIGLDTADASVVAIAQRLLTIPLSVSCGLVYLFSNVFSLPSRVVGEQESK